MARHRHGTIHDAAGSRTPCHGGHRLQSVAEPFKFSFYKQSLMSSQVGKRGGKERVVLLMQMMSTIAVLRQETRHSSNAKHNPCLRPLFESLRSFTDSSGSKYC